MIISEVSRVGNSLIIGVFFITNAHIRPKITPKMILVTVMNRKLTKIDAASEVPNCCSPVAESCDIIDSAARNRTIATASLITPSPNNIELSLGYFDSFTMLTAATVSVADSTQASRRHSFVSSTTPFGRAPLKLKKKVNPARMMKLINVPTNP
jgi:hypothetical protein